MLLPEGAAGKPAWRLQGWSALECAGEQFGTPDLRLTLLTVLGVFALLSARHWGSRAGDEPMKTALASGMPKPAVARSRAVLPGAGTDPCTPAMKPIKLSDLIETLEFETAGLGF
jgi:hypothetical protein